jgi:hypothetical protein
MKGEMKNTKTCTFSADNERDTKADDVGKPVKWKSESDLIIIAVVLYL